MSYVWEDLLKKSESYSKLSKPESLAVIDILKDSEELPFQAIYDMFIKSYQSETTQRQLRYVLTTMEENELIIKNSDGYSLNNQNVSITKSPLSIYEAILLALSLIVFFITWNIAAFGIFIGVVVCILLHQIEYTFAQRKKPKIDKVIEKIIK